MLSTGNIVGIQFQEKTTIVFIDIFFYSHFNQLEDGIGFPIGRCVMMRVYFRPGRWKEIPIRSLVITGLAALD